MEAGHLKVILVRESSDVLEGCPDRDEVRDEAHGFVCGGLKLVFAQQIVQEFMQVDASCSEFGA